MKNKRRATKLTCYILALIMVMSCFCVTSYAVEGDEPQTDITVEDNNSNDVTEPAANEGEEGEPATPAPEGDGDGEGGEPAVEPEAPAPFDNANLKAVVTGNLEGPVVVEASWVAVDGATGYTLDVNGKKTTVDADTTEATSAELSFNPGDKYEVKVICEGTENEYTKTIDTAGKVITTAPEYEQHHSTYADGAGKTDKYTSAAFKWGYNRHDYIDDNQVALSWDNSAIAEPDRYELVLAVKTDEGFRDIPIGGEGKYTKEAAPKMFEATGTYSYTEWVTAARFPEFESANEGKIYYSIKPVYDDVAIASARTEEVTVPKFLTCGARTYKFLVKTNTKAKFYKKGKGNSYKRWLPKGVTGYTTGGSGSKFLVQGTKYGQGYVMRAKMSCYKLDYSPKKDWSKSYKEKYVNSSSSFKSSGKYIIWVSRYTQKVNVFKKVSGKWQLQDCAECTTGVFRNYTSGGSYTIKKKQYKRTRSKHYYFHLSYYNGLNSLHGPTYWKKNSYYRAKPSVHLGDHGQYGTLGCVRMWNEDATYIYDNCPKGTKVVVY